METKTAFILITGKPNVGKSTLLNALAGEKIAIVSRRPQTTRNRITGVVTKGEAQYVFIDTPGLHRPRNLLGEYMMKAVGAASEDADIVLFMVDAQKPLTAAEKDALRKNCESGAKVILVINKVDITDKGALAAFIAEVSKQYDFRSVIPISALKNDGVDIVFAELDKLLLPSPHFFPDDMLTDLPERQLFAELIREKILRLTDDEVPHGVAVVIEDYSEEPGLLSVRAEIYCEKEAHKKILIGKNGAMLKKIGSYAREDAEKLFGTHIRLDLWVKVKENWRDRRTLLADFGYTDRK